MSAINKYFGYKSAVDHAKGKVEANPIKANIEHLGRTLDAYHVHCAEIVEKMVAVAPGMLDMIDKLQVGDSHD